jgi:lysophospholipase L1-like esterase
MAILHGAPVRIVLVGDSTVALGGGWGASFCALLTPNVECLDVAKNGRSSKSYYDEGTLEWCAGEEARLHFDSVRAQRHARQRDRSARPIRRPPMRPICGGTLQARAAKARPVIVTSLSRRTYKDGKLVQDLTAYAATPPSAWPLEENVPLIDLNAASVKLLQTMTQEQADQFDAEAHPDAAGNKGPDRTHLNATGAAVFARMVADGLAKVCVELGPDVKGSPKQNDR